MESVLDAFDQYLALERGRSDHTRRAYLGDLRSLFAFVDERTPGADLGSLTLPVLRAWLSAQAAAGTARTTLARRTSAVKTFTAWAVRRGLMASDPATRLQMPKARRTLPAVLRQDQARDALDAANSGAQQGDPLALRDRLIVEMLYATGIRVSELCGLDIDDVDTSRRLLRVLGKGDKQRTVPFGEPAEQALRAWLTSGRPALATAESGPALLLGARGRRLDPRQARTVVHETVGAVAGAPTSGRTACGTAPPPTCSKAVRTCGSCRNCWATRRSRPPSCTPTSPSRGSAPSTTRPTRGPERDGVTRPAASVAG